MNTYDKHQLTARELHREEAPAVLMLFLYAVALALGLFSAFFLAFSFTF